MRIRPTELGLKGLLLVAALEVAFLATSYSNLFFLLIVFCCVLGCAGLLTAVRNVRGLRVLGAELPSGPADTPRPLRLRLAVRRPAFDLVFGLVDDRGDTVELAPLAVVDDAVAATADLPGLPRGVRLVRAVQLTSRFPFGLFELRVRQPVALEIVTYPRPASAAAAPRMERAPHRATGVQPTGVAGLRPFRAGDAVRDVNWKATARRGSPIVVERDGDVPAALTLVVDRRVDGAALERELAAVTSAVLGVTTGGRAVRLQSQGYSVHLPAGQPPAADVLRWLAATTVLPPDAGGPQSAPGDRPERAHA